MTTIIFDKTFDSGWRKILTQRSELAKGKKEGGKTIDPYLKAPNGKKLRSNVELMNFLVWYSIRALYVNTFFLFTCRG